MNIEQAILALREYGGHLSAETAADVWELLEQSAHELAMLRGQVKELQEEAARHAHPTLTEVMARVLENTAVMREIRNIAITHACTMDDAAAAVARMTASEWVVALRIEAERHKVHAEVSRRIRATIAGHDDSPSWTAALTDAADIAAEAVCPTCGTRDNPACRRSWHRAITATMEEHPNHGTPTRNTAHL